MSGASSDDNAPSAAAVQENPNAPAAAPSQSMDGAVLVGDAATSSEAPIAPAPTAPALLENATQENPNAPAAAPSQSMDGAVLVGDVASSGDAPTAPASAGALLENPHPQAVAPSQSMQGARLVDDEAMVMPSEPPTRPRAQPQPKRPKPEPRRVVELPNKARLRLSFWFEGDELKCEGVLMNERRELVHRRLTTAERDDVIDRVYGLFATDLARDAHASKVLVVPAGPAPAEAETQAEES